MTPEQKPGFSESDNGIVLNNDEAQRVNMAPAQTAPAPQPQTQPQPEKKRKNPTKLIVSLLVIAALGFAISQINFTAIVDNITAIGYEAPADLQKIIDDIELTDDGMRILKATRPELQGADDFNNSCLNDSGEYSVLGCYSSNRVFVYNISEESLDGIRQTTLAHEFLHAVWHRMSQGEREELGKALREIYDSNEAIREHMNNYEGGGNNNNELHSVIGTTVKWDDLPEVLKKHYAKYFKNPSKLVTYYDKYYASYKQASTRIKELEPLIEKRRTTLKEMEEKYTKDNDQLTKDINDHNARARTPNGYSTVEEFNNAYSALVDRKNKMTADYRALNEYLEETNRLIDEYNNNALRMNKFQESINSRVGDKED